jgi:hypothetical protein
MTPLDLTRRIKAHQAHISKENQQDFIALCDRLFEELGWRDIATAPRSGEEVLGYKRESSVCGVVHHCVIMRWKSNEHHRFVEAEGGLFKKVVVDVGGWRTGTGWSEKEFAPDKWMPLPPPPEAA